jgi:ornithine cyclodeaminase/alanine dehydrogenase-like protein (mu-crystallin family)
MQRQDDEITVFKSVGHALEDLTAAKLVADFVKAQ